jgi:excisionase family DNA binding protein
VTRPSAEEWLKPAEIAEILQVRPDDITRLLRSGDIAGIKVGTKWRVRRSELDTYLDELAAPAEVPANSEIERLEFIELNWLDIVTERSKRRTRMLRALGPAPLPPRRDAGRDERVRYFFNAVAWQSQHCAIAMTPREQAEAAYTPTGASVDELEDRIRESRGLPPIDRQTGFERWDLTFSHDERVELEAEARVHAERGWKDNPQGLPFEEYLEVWRQVVGLVPHAPIDPVEELAKTRMQLAAAREEVVDD